MDGGPLLVAGATFERYRIDAALGRGGMGEVYRAFDTRLRRPVALKVLRRDRREGDSVGEVQRVLGEARAMAALTHPNIVTIYDVGEHEGTPYFTMELLDGVPLGRMCGGTGDVAPKARWAADIAAALAAAHRAGLAHRDVKPANVMITGSGAVKLLDFGIAKRLGASELGAEAPPISLGTPETMTGMLVGTPRYMAPEQLRGGRAGAATDQYAWGLVATELFTGSVPRAGDDPGPSLVAVGAPPAIVAAIRRALAVLPEHRFATMTDVVAALGATSPPFEPSAAPIPMHSTPIHAPPTVREGWATGVGAHPSRSLPAPLPAAHAPRSGGAGLAIGLAIGIPIALALLVVGAGVTAALYLRGEHEGSGPVVSVSLPTGPGAVDDAPPPDPTTTSRAPRQHGTAEPSATASSPTPSARPGAVTPPRPPPGVAPSSQPTPSNKPAPSSAPAAPATARAVDVGRTIDGKHLDPAAVDRELARLRPEIAACYQAPDCDKTGSPWCIDPKYDANLSWDLQIDQDSGAVATTGHSGGGLQTGNCVGKALRTLKLSAYTWEPGRSNRERVTVTVRIR